jgi:hypothetical protein
MGRAGGRRSRSLPSWNETIRIGSFVPPPTLSPKHAQALSETLASWALVHARTHWLLGDESVADGADFYLGDEELGHLHLDGEAGALMTLVTARAKVVAA